MKTEKHTFAFAKGTKPQIEEKDNVSTVLMSNQSGNGWGESIHVQNGVKFYCRTFGTVVDDEARIVRLEADFRIGEMKRPKWFHRNLQNAYGVNTVTFEPYTITVTYGSMFSGDAVAHEIMWIAKSAFAPSDKFIAQTESDRPAGSNDAMCFEVRV